MLAAALVLLGLLGIPAWWASDAPLALALPAMTAGLVGAGVLALRERARPPVGIRLHGDAPVRVDGLDVEDFDVHWRGPLVALSWRSGRHVERRLAFPDALDVAARRELRLWALRRREDAPPAAVAP